MHLEGTQSQRMDISAQLFRTSGLRLDLNNKPPPLIHKMIQHHKKLSISDIKQAPHLLYFMKITPTTEFT